MFENGGGYIGGLSVQTARRAVDDDIEAFRRVCQSARQHAELFRQLMRFGRRAVGNGNGGRFLRQQRLQHAAHRAARAQHQNPFAAQGNVLAGDVPHQTDAVGVVGFQTAV